MTHPLLTRLMRRLGLSTERAPDAATWAAFVERVDEVLNEADSDRRVLERSLQISSEEMRELYEEARRSSDTALAVERDKLAKSVAALQATLAAADDGILFVDENRRFASHNARFVEMWHLPPGIVGAGDDETAIRHVLSMVQDPASWGARVEECYADPSLSGHDEFEMLDGRVFERYTAPVQTEGGTIVGRVWFFRDVTTVRRTVEALRSANRFLDSIVENIPDMVFVKDAHDLRFIRLNRAGEDLLGLPQKDLLGRSDADFFPPEEAQFFLAKDREVLTRGELVSIEQEQITTRKGETRVLSTKKIPIAGDDGQPLYLLGISRDITQAQRGERELRAAKDAAEAAARAKADFLANMSHELRTPLNAILGFSRILARSPSLSGNEREHARFVVTGAEHMLALVNDLLDLRRLEERVVASEALELEPILHDAAALVRPLAEERSQWLVVESGPVRVMGERMTLTQALVNLLSNAIKFTPPGGHIRMIAEPRGSVVRLSVQDDGEGIAPADQPRVFDYFEQVGGKHAHRMKGSGIGLALTRKLIQALGSSIMLTSKLGVGSTFAFELRVADDGPAASPQGLS